MEANTVECIKARGDIDQEGNHIVDYLSNVNLSLTTLEDFFVLPTGIDELAPCGDGV